VLVVGTVVGDAANDFFWVVAAGESTFGKGPVNFRLTFVVGRQSLVAPLTVDSVSRLFE